MPAFASPRSQAAALGPRGARRADPRCRGPAGPPFLPRRSGGRSGRLAPCRPSGRAGARPGRPRSIYAPGRRPGPGSLPFRGRTGPPFPKVGRKGRSPLPAPGAAPASSRPAERTEPPDPGPRRHGAPNPPPGSPPGYRRDAQRRPAREPPPTGIRDRAEAIPRREGTSLPSSAPGRGDRPASRGPLSTAGKPLPALTRARDPRRRHRFELSR